MRIYVAGPYSPQSPSKHTCIQEAAHNVDRAIRVALVLISKGHYPFVPHLTHYIHVSSACQRELGERFYYEYDNTFLDHWAEALFYMGSSKGADAELERAKRLGLKIFYDFSEVPDLFERNREDLPFLGWRLQE